jgi:1-phosphofructokinase
MKFAVLSLNPGIDRALYLSDPMNPGHMNRAARTVTSQGSKGANVSVVLHRLGFDVTYYAFTGGLYGELCEKIIAAEGLKAKYTGTACGIRVNTKVTDCNRLCTEFNEKGGPVTPEEYEALTQSFLQDDAEVVYMCGSFPQGVENTVYKELVRVEKSLGRNVVLDCSGEALTQAVVSSPDVIKPNIDELADLASSLGLCEHISTGCGLSPGDAQALCAKISSAFGIGRVICTMGEKGAVENTGKYSVSAFPAELRGFSGAGDCFLAGFGAAVYGMGLPDAEAMRFAAACGAAKVALEGTLLPTAADIEKILGYLPATIGK